MLGKWDNWGCSRILATLALCVGVVSFAAAQTDVSDEVPSLQLSATEVIVTRDAHFAKADGTHLVVPAGTYVVDVVGDAALKLQPEDGATLTVAASITEHEEELDEPIALSDEVTADEFHIVFLMPDGVTYDAAATYSGIVTRAGRARRLDAKRISLARQRYNRVYRPQRQAAQPKRPTRVSKAPTPARVSRPSQAAPAQETQQAAVATQKTTVTPIAPAQSGRPVPATPAEMAKGSAPPPMYVVPGSPRTFRLEKSPMAGAYGVRIQDSRGRNIGTRFATASVERGAVTKLTIAPSKQMRLGNYRLMLFGKDGKLLASTAIPLHVVAADHPAVQQNLSTATAGTQTVRPELTGKMTDPARDWGRADQLQGKLGQFGQGGLAGLDPAGLSGGGFFVDLGEDLRAGFIDQLGGFPDGDFEGLLDGVGGSGRFDLGAGMPGINTGSDRMQPGGTSFPGKDSSMMQGGSAGDSRLMSGGGGSTTYHITSSSTDYESDDGSLHVTDSITVKDSDGNTFTHTMTHTTDSDGNVTETQTATATDKNGNTTTESSCTGKNCEDSGSSSGETSDTEGATASNEGSSGEGADTSETSGEDTSTASSTPANDQSGGTSSTPDPEGGGECTGPSCDEFEEFADSLLASLATNRIEPVDPYDSLTQPAGPEGGYSSAGRDQAAVMDEAGKVLDPYILHDNAGDSGIPLPAGSQPSPTGTGQPAPIDPPEEDMLVSGNRPPGSTPTKRDDKQ